MVTWRSIGWVCTCPVGIKRGHFKHTLCMTIVRGEVDCPEEAKTVPIGRKGKWGSPSRVARPFARDDGR